MSFGIRFFLVSAAALSMLQISGAAQKEIQKASSATEHSPVTHELAASSKESTSTVSVKPSEPVITVQGLCRGGTDTNDAGCNKVMTREEFENLLNAINPGGQPVSPIARRNLAQAYAELLAFEAAAKDAGMEDTAQFRELVNWLRLRTVADLYRRHLQEEFRTPSPDEIDSYYNQHLASFERVRLARILIPREDLPPVDKNEFEKKAVEAARIAQQRAAQGEDPDQIQKDVYVKLDIKAPPATDLGNFRRADLQEKESAEVFSLKPGEVSQLETEPKSYVIYKVISRDTLPKEQVKAEITREISQQKFNNALKTAIDSTHTEFNEKYFGEPISVASPAKPPALPARPQSR